MPTEQQLSARIEMLQVEARRANRRSRIALLAAIAGPTAIQLRRVIVAEGQRSDATIWVLLALSLALTALALSVWFRQSAWRLREEILALGLLRDALTGKLRDLR